ncbi:hypothetical protein Sjap_020126 [Stephania japonica]|uniref:Protein kinase domain-containing protein n=1 Tax=Stephania japonica TaxID=461633 RepID=A0AAP0F5M1_9MAGN
MLMKQEHPMLGLCYDNSYEKVIHDYEPQKTLDEGSYGCVWKSVKKHSGDVVAIKKIKDEFNCSSLKECMNLREVKALRGVGDHPAVEDLGMAREVLTNGDEMYTKYVTILWYRALEVLLETPTYTLAVDMRAKGLSLRKVIWKVRLYHPQEELNFTFPKKYGSVDKLDELVPNTDEDAISLIRWLCSWVDLKRLMTIEALRHPFFANNYTIPKSMVTHGPKMSRAVSSAKRKNTKYLNQFKKARVA